MAKKTLHFTCYRIVKSETLFSTSNIVKDLCDALVVNETVESRLISLGTRKESKSRHVLSWYEKSEDEASISFVIVRMNLSDNVKEIKKRLLTEKLFMIEDLSTHELGAGNGVYSSHYYVSMNSKYLISNCGKIKYLENYINTYLNSDYKLVPLIDDKEVVRLKDVDSVEFFGSSEEFVMSKKSKGNNSLISGLLHASLKSLSLISEINSLEEEKMANCISATLKIKISGKDTYGDLQNTLGAILKPIGNLDNVAVITKDGRKLVKGSSLVVMRNVEIEDDNNYISETKLKLELERVLSEITRGEDEKMSNRNMMIFFALIPFLLGVLSTSITLFELLPTVMSTLYTVLTIVFSVGMGIVCSLNFGVINNDVIYERLCKRVLRLRDRSLILFAFDTVLYLLYFCYNSNVVVCVFDVDVFIGWFSFFFMLMSLIYFCVNFRKLHDLNFDILDELRKYRKSRV